MILNGTIFVKDETGKEWIDRGIAKEVDGDHIKPKTAIFNSETVNEIN